MDIEQIKSLLHAELELDELFVSGEGSHYKVIAVGRCFDGLNRVKQQQLVYRPLNPAIADGSLHALTIKAFTPEQWQRERIFQQPGS